MPSAELPVFLDCEASGWPPDGVAIEVAWGEPGVDPEFAFGPAHAVIPDVSDRMPDLIPEARAAAGGIHRAAADVRFLILLYTAARQAAGR